jgi:hypothetical protein
VRRLFFALLFPGLFFPIEAGASLLGGVGLGRRGHGPAPLLPDGFLATIYVMAHKNRLSRLLVICSSRQEGKKWSISSFCDISTLVKFNYNRDLAKFNTFKQGRWIKCGSVDKQPLTRRQDDQMTR